MRIRCDCSFNRAQVQEIIRFVRPPGISGFDVWIKRGSSHRGTAYVKGSYWRSRRGPFRDRPGKPTKRTPYILVTIPPWADRPGKVRVRWAQSRGYIGFSCYNRTEALVFLLAHECRHLWHAKVKKGRRVWGARGQYSERDADAYAIRRLRHWRRAGSPFYNPDGTLLKHHNRIRHRRNSDVCDPHRASLTGHL